MSDEGTPKPENPEKPSKAPKGKNKRSLTFPEMLERRNFSVPDEAYRLYKSLKNPLAQFIAQFRAAGVPETTIETLKMLVESNAGYYRRKVECLKLISTYAHPKPKEEPLPPPPTWQKPEEPKADPKNKYAKMTTEQLIAGLPLTDEGFDTGSIAPGS